MKRRASTPRPQPIGPAITHSLTSARGYTVKLRAEPMSDGTYRVVEWKRKRPHWRGFRRDPRHVGGTYRPEQLHLPVPQPSLFGSRP